MTNTDQGIRRASALLCLMSIFAFASFIAIDPFMTDGPLLPLLRVRVIAIIIGAGLFYLAISQRAIIQPQMIGMTICIVTGISVILLTELTGGAASPYWTMVMLTFFAVSLILPLNPMQASVCFGSIALFYSLWLWYVDAMGTPAEWAVSNAGIWLALVLSILSVAFLQQLRTKEALDREQLKRLNVQLRQEIEVREQAENTIRHAQKLEAFGQLAAGLAHEINNSLMVISLSAEALAKETTSGTANIQRILQSAQQGARLTSDMLVFARRSPLVSLPFSLHEVVQSVRSLLDNYQRERIQVELDLAAAPLWIKGDSQLMTQVILNLCLNGINAIQSTGTIKLITRQAPDRPNHARLDVIDNGKGMSETEIQRAFEPFFTTKAPGKGTGLGLSVAYGTIKDHGGSISLRSKVGHGTTVTVLLPTTQIEGKQEPQDVITPAATATLQSSKVLLVDDDSLVSNVMTEMLCSLGAAVITANNGQEAISCLKQGQHHFDVVILDIMMPVMDGEETFYQLRALNPQQKILIYSGYAKAQGIRNILQTGDCLFLPKPFTCDALADSLQTLLNNHQPMA